MVHAIKVCGVQCGRLDPLTFIVWGKTVKYNVFLEPDPASTDVSLQQKLQLLWCFGSYHSNCL